MPTTGQNISLLLRRLPNYSRPELLDFLSEAQIIAYSQDVEQVCKYDPANKGMPPYLVTHDQIYEYDCPDDCRRVRAVFSEDVPRKYTSKDPIWWNKNYYFNQKTFYNITVSSIDQMESLPAKVTFPYNPGDTTTKYYLHYYMNVLPLNTEDDQLSLQPHLHWLLRELVLAMARREDYGNTDATEVAIARILRKFRNEQNRGAQRRRGYTPVREEYRDYSFL